ncbi:MAG: hypothetical protein ACD_30C00019G0002 [uncultured bacterium]|uniref:Uncharacterized protein n=3 Tax=Candidatus Daviesiibacteriota TaxID=1752718 RepID=A0A1F5K6T1_9BACT|nr:MAG: hypothetical protein ACD_30C00019G0002 [uncultured bacterium]KKQ15566.1 MAG: hypothetical protein US28_C0014G0009 [Candidatus Daviesbacteria bacterium GW2011_GWA1_36_8]OGE17543.1 MAG: hypothetical protein A2858_01420 [Candidatus Daviesbacteria bacterium RIFCSPHIGHO2_01_FULL_36_37]OGE36637.1 MAG: hypothetical protein A3E66_03265 [Candidatus Daviesbacteria bacterium RIFCSPHIGHO2_12_FULL_37_16]
MTAIREISVGVEFPLFEFTESSEVLEYGVDEEQSFNLILPTLPEERKVLIEQLYLPDIIQVGDFIAPFNPKLGYEITFEDFDAEGRAKKIVENLARYSREVNLEKYSYGILDLSRNITQKEELIDIEKNDPGLLTSLVLKLHLPVGIYESATDTEYDADFPEDFSFSSFYPIDTGRIAIVEHVFQEKYDGIFNKDDLKPGIGYGDFRLALPNDIERLSQITAQFIMNRSRI